MSWGPGGRRAAVSVTFDNLGEAMDLSLGIWPEGRAVGEHFTVLDVLPRVLSLLADHGVRCTYFAEGWSAGVYPGALRDLVAGSHEIAYHGWCHEHWAGLTDRLDESELIRRGVEAMRGQGIELRGFRPPGGVLTPWTVELSLEHGFTYLSPAARHAGWLADGVAAVPFRWTAIDAYYLFDAFAPLRRQLGDGDAPLGPRRMVEGMKAAIAETVAAGGCLSLLFHPFLQDDPEHFAGMREVVELVANHPDVWCAPAGDHAAWMREQTDHANGDPELDPRSWR